MMSHRALLAFLALAERATGSDRGGSAHCAEHEMHPGRVDTVAPPPLPEAVATVLSGNLTAFDPDGAAAGMFAALDKPGFSQFPHARSSFAEHLKGTFSILSAWRQPRDVRRAGLFHTSYGGDLFIFHYWEAQSPEERAELSALVGPEAEELIYLFGTAHRAQINATLHSSPLATLAPDPVVVGSRTDGHALISPAMAAKIMVVTLADYLDQMVEVNGWRDSHQEPAPPRLYPGSGRPEIALHWVSRVCRGIRDYLEVVPPIFKSCTAEISRADEVAARDAYWAVVAADELADEAQESGLRAAIALNPWVGEPRVQLAQVLFRAGRHAEAGRQARAALGLMYQMCTAWDKRLPFQQWVSFTRMMLLRADRLASGLTDLPEHPEHVSYVGKRHMVNVRDVTREMRTGPSPAVEV